MNITEKGKWKYIPIEKRFFDDNTFEGFGSMQVLTNYEITDKGKIVASATASSENTKKGDKKKKLPGIEKTGQGTKTSSEKQKKRQIKNATSGTNLANSQTNDKIQQRKNNKGSKNKTKIIENTSPNDISDARNSQTIGNDPQIKQTKKKKRLKRKIKTTENTSQSDVSDSNDIANSDEKQHIPQQGDPQNASSQEKPAVKKQSQQQKKKKKNKQIHDKRFVGGAQLIDITDVEKHTKQENPVGNTPSQSQSKKRKSGDDGGPNKKKSRKNNKKKNNTNITEPHTEMSSIESKETEKKQQQKKKDPPVNMSKWKELFIPDVVLKALADAKFEAPTPIQCLTIPSAIRDRQDILGAAETGSGKTLAFGIPMIHNILHYKEAHPDNNTDSESENEEDEDDWDSEGEEKLEFEGESGEDEGESGGEGDDQEADDTPMSEDESNSDEEGEEDVEEEEDIEESEDEGENEESEDEGENEDDEEEDDGGEYDLAPEGDEEYFDLKEGEMGCVKAMNNVDFSWMDEETDQNLADPTPDLERPAKARKTGPLHGLVLTPTRELAIQVKNHLQQACAHTDIRICCVVGGMASQKQERILRKGPEIVVATPGRFWELLQQGEPHLAKVARLRTLVIDEADRMVEKGHFDELRSFFEFLKENETSRRRRQTFVFSATLTMVHQAPVRLQLKKKKVKQLTSDDKLQSLMELIGLNTKAKVIDITRKVGTAETLVESKINCTSDEKDIYLYYFLQRYKGRTLVFSNSKDCLRRLVSVFTLLNCNPLPLHADMHQRQRLKNLDRFKADSNGLLLATDVAARGLDIPGVEHVIHYQVPRTTENYVHRSGRTARASKEGLSVVLIGQEDMANYRKIIRTLNRSEELGVFPVEQEFMAAMKQRVSLARRIDKEEHRCSKQKKQNMWFEKAAKEMDLELDEDALLNDLGDSHAQAAQKQRLTFLRRDLKTLISQPVIPRAFSGRYPTKMGKLDLPLNAGSYQGGACEAARKESKANKRFNLSNTSWVKTDKAAKKAGKKKYKRKR